MNDYNHVMDAMRYMQSSIESQLVYGIFRLPGESDEDFRTRCYIATLRHKFMWLVQTLARSA